MHHAAPILDSALRAVEQGAPAALCAVVSAAGSTPQTAGALMLLHADLRTEGTLGGGCVEAEVRKQAIGLLNERRARVLQFKLDHDYGWDDGLICGGRLDIAVVPLDPAAHAERLRAAAAALRQCSAGLLEIECEAEPHDPRRGDTIIASDSAACTNGAQKPAPRRVRYRLHFEQIPTLLIAGAGHVGVELAALARRLEFRVRVFDDRADLLVPKRFPPPIECVLGPIEQRLAAEPIHEGTYVVIVTRGHRHDEQALRAVIDSPAGYIGMIGSRRKSKLIFDDLLAMGISAERLARVHSPIGLPIDAVTVPEIGVSIAAQLVAHRRAGQKRVRRVEGPIWLESAALTDVHTGVA